MTYSGADQTCAQVSSIPIRDLNREAWEMKRLAGARAHVFLWVSGHVFAEDPQLSSVDAFVSNASAKDEVPQFDAIETIASTGSGMSSMLYEGIKLHEMETPWARERPKDLARILAIADERGLPVQFHSAAVGECRPTVLARWAKKFPNVRFDFAHCPNPAEMSRVIADHPNVWTDVAYRLCGKRRGRCGRGVAQIAAWKQMGVDGEAAFRVFLQGDGDQSRGRGREAAADAGGERMM